MITNTSIIASLLKYSHTSKHTGIGASPVLSKRFLFMLCFACVPLQAQTGVLTQHNDNQRTGQNLSETVLTPANVNVTSFGKLFSFALDDQTYGQPLVLPFWNGHKNAVFAATVNNSVYCFDAETGAQIWHDSLGTAARRTDNSAFWCPDITDKMGIVSTPAIDSVSQTLYVVAITNDGGGNFSWKLHALGLGAGEEKFGGPIVIATTGFNTLFQNQRASLLVANNNVYIAFSSHCDAGSYHGYLFAYNTTSLAQVGVFNDTPTGTLGGIWMAGGGPAADSNGYVYLGTGNGTWDGTQNFGESWVKLSSNCGLVDWFTPNNWGNLNGSDQDEGSGGLMIIPGTNDMVGGGKPGYWRLLNINGMGHVSNGDTGAIQSVQVVFPPTGDTGHLHGGPVYFNSPTNGPTLYAWGENDHGRAYKFNGGRIQTPSFSQTAAVAPVSGGPGMPGASLYFRQWKSEWHPLDQWNLFGRRQQRG